MMIHLKFVSYNKDQFKQICSFIKVSKPKYVGVFLYKLFTSLSNKQLAFSFGVMNEQLLITLIYQEKIHSRI